VPTGQGLHEELFSTNKILSRKEIRESYRRGKEEERRAGRRKRKHEEYQA
jgi:hypothetical protein